MYGFSTCFDFVTVAVNQWHVIRKRNRWKIPDHMFTYWCLYFPLCYFIWNARRDTVAEKEFDIIILMTLESILVHNSRKKKWAKKINFLQRHLNVTKEIKSCGRMIYLKFILT